MPVSDNLVKVATCLLTLIEVTLPFCNGILLVKFQLYTNGTEPYWEIKKLVLFITIQIESTFCSYEYESSFKFGNCNYNSIVKPLNDLT